jgi:nonsense-mediated mRNA decay protein 3
MVDSEYCVVCGATGRPLVDSVCGECAADRTTLISAPERAVVVMCPHCGARQVKDHWERENSSSLLTAEDLAPFLTIDPEAGVRRIRWDERSATATVRELLGTAEVVYRGARRSVEIPLSVKTEHRTCTDCSRKSGKYYTAIVQLRGPEEARPERAPALRARLDGIWRMIVQEARPDWRKAVSWREELPEGWNVFFTETLAARALARAAQQRFGASLKQSATLFGRKDGRDVYRVTFCLRFPRTVSEPAVTGSSARPAAPLEP